MNASMLALEFSSSPMESQWTASLCLRPGCGSVFGLTAHWSNRYCQLVPFVGMACLYSPNAECTWCPSWVLTS